MDEDEGIPELKSHPVCMTSGEGLTFEMEKYFQAVQPELSMRAKRILEGERDAPGVLKLGGVRATDGLAKKVRGGCCITRRFSFAGLPLAESVGISRIWCAPYGAEALAVLRPVISRRSRTDRRSRCAHWFCNDNKKFGTYGFRTFDGKKEGLFPVPSAPGGRHQTPP